MNQLTCQRPYELQQLLNLLKSVMTEKALEPINAYQLTRHIFSTLDNTPGIISTEQPRQVAACRHFDAAIDNIRNAVPSIYPFADALAALEPRLHWRHRRPAKNLLGTEHENIASAILVGPDGLEQREDIQIGMTLMAPNMLFTEHRHPPQEVYAVLSKGQWRQNNQPWHEPMAGGFVYNPANIVHAFRSTDAPLLAIWCLA
ncbi:MAG: dimethylsulfoniopropionate lyase [Pseudomonadales bacterium]|nr:dimethylsulfoniopropionate lyase [Pseudomonadales bacterium]NRA17936.1 transcriptional regulator [Oceanospirillaceae bacterium]